MNKHIEIATEEIMHHVISYLADPDANNEWFAGRVQSALTSIYQRGREDGIRESIKVANESKATFFVNKDYIPDEKIDKEVDEALYELKAEIVDSLALLLIPKSPINTL